MFSPEIERALHVAQVAHEGQTRKGSDTPYIVHPTHVALLLARAGADEVTIQAGILHDVVEDCDDWTLERIEREFGARVRALVAELTEDKDLDWEARKESAVDHVPHMSANAALIKAADKLHNLSTLLADVRAAADPTDVWRHFTRDAEQTLEMSRALVDALAERVDRSLARALRNTLAELRRASGL